MTNKTTIKRIIYNLCIFLLKDQYEFTMFFAHYLNLKRVFLDQLPLEYKNKLFFKDQEEKLYVWCEDGFRRFEIFSFSQVPVNDIMVQKNKKLLEINEELEKKIVALSDRNKKTELSLRKKTEQVVRMVAHNTYLKSQIVVLHINAHKKQ